TPPAPAPSSSRWPAPRSPPAPTGSSSSATPSPAAPAATARRRCRPTRWPRSPAPWRASRRRSADARQSRYHARTHANCRRRHPRRGAPHRRGDRRADGVLGLQGGHGPLVDDPLSLARAAARGRARRTAASVRRRRVDGARRSAEVGRRQKSVAPRRAPRLLRARDQHLEDGDPRVPRARARLRARGDRIVRDGARQARQAARRRRRRPQASHQVHRRPDLVAAHVVAHRRGPLDDAVERPARRSAADEDPVPPGGRVMKLSLAYSTDLDDAFMFWPLATGRLDPRAFGFDGAEHVRSDTATLNGWARDGVHDVVAVSIAAVPSLARDWLLLPHGGSVGRNYGPVIVAPRALAVDELRGLRVGVPGATTTCARLVALAAPGAVQIEVPSAPLERAFAALADGAVDACALIHEGRLTYGERGLHLVCDLGQFWQRTRNLPIPLGGNVIKRAL